MVHHSWNKRYLETSQLQDFGCDIFQQVIRVVYVYIDSTQIETFD